MASSMTAATTRLGTTHYERRSSGTLLGKDMWSRIARNEPALSSKFVHKPGRAEA